MNATGLRIGLVGPLPTPSGGMANQTLQLAKLLREEGAIVKLIQVNRAYTPRWIENIKGVRAIFRLLPYFADLWQSAGQVQLFHIMANSGWSWHLFAAPAIWVAKIRGKKVVVNYRGGEADTFFDQAFFWVKPSLKKTDAIIVPSSFLEAVFKNRSFATNIVSNIIDLQRFSAGALPSGPWKAEAPQILVARNLETIYDNATALRAFHIVRGAFPSARFTVAGSGPERQMLEQLAVELGLADAITFTGRVENEGMAALYRSADIMVNPSLADNMPISILEALASGVPVVTTNVGGIPHLVEHEKTALLVQPQSPQAMAAAILALLNEPTKAQRLKDAGIDYVRQYAWQNVRDKLLGVYEQVLKKSEASHMTPEKSTLYTSLVSRVLFPLHERYKKHHSVAVRKAMEQSQWWSEQQLRQLQLKKLRQLLAHVQVKVPYYRDLFAAIGFKADDVQSLADLARLPLLDKPTIRANTDALKSENARHLARFNTGGSSGEPLIFFIGKERVSHDVAAKWRATRWWGVDIGDPEIVVWGSPIELGAQDGVRALRDCLFRTKLLPAFEMSTQKLDGFLDEIRRMRPKMLFGYPSALSHFARHAATKGLRMDDLGIKVAFVTSERLYDEQRHQIETTFGCRVANGYGGRDAGFIAHDCPQGGMHITAEDIIVEIVDPQGSPLPAGESGEIVVTHLATGDFPFIRYRTGDIGVLDSKSCACGRGLPLLKEIQGRTTDFLVAQNGTVMHGLALIYILRDLPQVGAFKIIQESLELTRVLVAAKDILTAELIAKIDQGFKARLGSEVQIIVEQVSEIPAEKSGKFRYVVSKVKPA